MYEDMNMRNAIMETIQATRPAEHTTIRKALGLSVHQGVKRLGARGATYFEPLCGADADRARFSTYRYQQVDQLLTCPKCIDLVNDDI